jgi:hypothetical protein
MGKILGLIGGVMLAVGLTIGFVPVSASGASCGSAFVASDSAAVADYMSVLRGQGMGQAVDDCASSRSSWRLVALALLIPGALVGGAGLFALATAKENA